MRALTAVNATAGGGPHEYPGGALVRGCRRRPGARLAALRPVGFETGRRYPIAFLVHGGLQGAWLDQFHYRWNPQIYAAAGDVPVAINFHGSTGYGRTFTDAIRTDWAASRSRTS